jgi:hypothetical protein
MLYRRGANGPVEGGSLTLAIDLRLTPAETAAVAAAATTRRAAAIAAAAAAAGSPAEQPGAREQPPPPTVRLPDWKDGTAEVELVPGIKLVGRPSLYDVNHCVLVLEVPPDRAGDVQKAWDEGFPEAVATMDVTAEGAASVSSAASATASVRGPQLTAQYGIGLGAQATRPAPLSLHLQGPLRLPASARTTRRTDLTL